MVMKKKWGGGGGDKVLCVYVKSVYWISDLFLT